MEPFIYSYSLCVALPLMLFFGFYFLFAKTPEKVIFENYLRSRRIMGIALLLLAANYSVHFFFGIRFVDVNAAILMNLSTYFLCYWLFSSALTTLLDRFYITRRRLQTHLGMWLLFSVLSGVILLLLPGGTMQKVGLAVMAVWLIGYGLFLVATGFSLSAGFYWLITGRSGFSTIRIRMISARISNGCPSLPGGLSYSA